MFTSWDPSLWYSTQVELLFRYLRNSSSFNIQKHTHLLCHGFSHSCTHTILGECVCMNLNLTRLPVRRLVRAPLGLKASSGAWLWYFVQQLGSVPTELKEGVECVDHSWLKDGGSHDLVQILSFGLRFNKHFSASLLACVPLICPGAVKTHAVWLR